MNRLILLIGSFLTLAGVTLPSHADTAQIRLMAQYSRVFESAFNQIITSDHAQLKKNCGTTDFTYQFHAVPENWSQLPVLRTQGPLIIGGFYVTFFFDLEPESQSCQDYLPQLKEHLSRLPSVLATFHLQ